MLITDSEYTVWTEVLEDWKGCSDTEMQIIYDLEGCLFDFSMGDNADLYNVFLIQKRLP